MVGIMGRAYMAAQGCIIGWLWDEHSYQHGVLATIVITGRVYPPAQI